MFTQWNEGSVHTERYTGMCIEAFFLIATTWKQPRCPSVGEWIHEPWYIQTTEYYSALKKKRNYQAMKSLRGTLHAYYGVKSAYLKNLHTI